MKKMFLILLILIVAAGAAVTVPFIAAAITGKGEVKQFRDENGEVLEGSVAEKISMEIGGRKNGMIIRGKSTENPVLLFISGGPGVPEYWLNEYYDNKIEDEFTVCWWDYYGEGLSYDSGLKPEDITLEKLESDAVEVSDYLKQRFGKEKIYLMAHSAGSMLGLRLAQDYPDNFYCYFAMGQSIDGRFAASYSYLKDYFEKTGNNRGLRLINKHVRMENNEPVVYNEKKIDNDWESALLMAGCATTREMRSDAFDIFFPQMFSKCYTYREKINYWKGKALCQNSAYADTCIQTEGEKAAQIPVCFISGRYDYTCIVDLVEELYGNLCAPQKELYIFEDSAHSPLWEENEAVLEVMKKHAE